MSKNPGWADFFIAHFSFVVALLYNVFLYRQADRFALAISGGAHDTTARVLF
jgi:hypothetical protein